MRVEITKNLPHDGVLALYQDAGWWEASDEPAVIGEMLANTPLIAAAFEGEQLIGMARALTDMKSDACIQDVVVLGSFRRQGVGVKLVEVLVAQLRRNGVGFIELIAVPGQQKFYESCGFQVMPGHLPMKFEGGL